MGCDKFDPPDIMFLDREMEKELLERFYDAILALLAGRRGAKAQARRLVEVYKRTHSS